MYVRTHVHVHIHIVQYVVIFLPSSASGSHGTFSGLGDYAMSSIADLQPMSFCVCVWTGETAIQGFQPHALPLESLRNRLPEEVCHKGHSPITSYAPFN